MAEAITVIGAVASIVQIIDVVTKVINYLSDIRSQWKDADLACLSLAAQLTTLRAALTKIHEWMDDSLGAAHHQLIMDLDVSISCCNLLILKIDSLLPNLAELTESELDFPGKMKVLFGSRNIDEAQKLIERQTSALSLLLSACSCKTIAEQKTLLEKSKSRKQINRIQSDSASLWVHRDTDTLRSRFSDNLSKLSMVFPFDNIVFSSNVYERVFRGSIKESLRRQQNGPPNETRKQGKDMAAFLAFLGEGERSSPVVGTGIEVDPRPQAKQGNYALMHLKRKPQKDKKVDYKIMLMSGDNDETSWLLEKIERVSAHSVTSQLAMDKTIVHCGNLLVSAMENFAIRPRNISSYDPYTFLTENHPYPFLDALFMDAMMSIWQDPCISTVLERSAGLPSMDIVPHFLDALVKRPFSGHVPHDFREYKPDLPGIHQTRWLREVGRAPLTAYHFVRMESTLSEIGHVVQECDAILIIVNLSRYYQIDDNQRPRIMNDLDLYESVITSGLLKNMAIFLIFVQSTTFKEDLSTHPLKVYFPDYSGQRAEEFISAQFEKIQSRDIVSDSAHRVTYSQWRHPEDARGITNWIYVVVREAKNQNMLRSSGLI